jgi:transposase InsO family protein
MPWREASVIELREEFVGLAMAPGANVSDLCRRFGIERSTGHKWLKRYKAEGSSGLVDRSRRPHVSPLRTDAATESEVLRIRAESNNAWGGRKIAWTLGQADFETVPAPSTISDILRRHGKLDHGSQHPGPHVRFERAEPNELWQMDFKGHFPMASGRCHPLTVLDDHSRYSLGIEACGNEQDGTVRDRLTTLFRRYGLPFAMLMDNGSPWGDSGGQPYTVFTIWLMRHGVAVSHGRPYHPQTQGKVERFHRSLKAEVLERNSYADLQACQSAFDWWRQIYNCKRPHEALGDKPPVDRYRPSPRLFCENLPPIAYGSGDIVRRVDVGGVISFRNRFFKIGKAFRKQPLALRATSEDGLFDVHYCTQHIGQLDLKIVEAKTCGFMDIARAMPTTPQVPQQQQITNASWND